MPFGQERDRVDRALVGSNQQKQAVPLINPQSPIGGTGVEADIAKNSGQLVVAEADGEIVSSTAEQVVVSYKGKKSTHKLSHFMRLK